MEMSQIRYFLAVCEHRNFTHAAQASNVSQPSLTASIKKLEDELGGRLFLRDRAGCQLTPLGRLMLPRLQRIHNELHEAKTDAIRFNRLERVPIRIGLGDTIGQRKIAESIERFRRCFPEADIELIIDSYQALLSGLREGSFDIIISSSEESSDLYRIDELYKEGYRVVVSEDHDLAQYETVSLNQLANTNMLDRPNCEMRDSLNQTCTENGYSLYASYRSNRIEWLLELARKGAGAVILPVTAIPCGTGTISIPIEGLDINRKVSAIRYRQQPTRPEVENLIGALKEIERH